MKNLRHYRTACFPIHQQAVAAKRDVNLRLRLEALHALIEAAYAQFDNYYTPQQWNQLVPDTILATSRDDLLTLYVYQSAVIRAIRKNVQDLQIQTVSTTCQNCTLDSVSTLDHMLPKSAFPEFVVNPRNLFPCCAVCNSRKLNVEHATGERQFLNLYLDMLPDVQYLFVEIHQDHLGNLDLEYYLENPEDSINADLFELIRRHYTRLDLFHRMKMRSVEYLGEFEHRMAAFHQRLSIVEIQGAIDESMIASRSAYGVNHWKCVLEAALMQSPLFIARISQLATITLSTP